MTPDQFERLKPYDMVLRMAVNGNSNRRLMRNQRTELAQIYSEITHTKPPCGSCGSKEWLKRLSRWYLNYKTQNT